MRKQNFSFIVTLLCIMLFTGCSYQKKDNLLVSSPIPTTILNTFIEDTIKSKESSDISMKAIDDNSKFSIDYINAYLELVKTKTKDYSLLSVEDFNNEIIRQNKELANALQKYSIVLNEFPQNDLNDRYFLITLACSLDELYCQEIGDDITFDSHAVKKENPIMPLNEEEKELLGKEPPYEFIFTVFYELHYYFPDTKVITVGERDRVIEDFQSELQLFIESKTKEELITDTIRETLSKEVIEIVKELSTENMELSCKINSIEYHDSGKEYQK